MEDVKKAILKVFNYYYYILFFKYNVLFIII